MVVLSSRCFYYDLRSEDWHGMTAGDWAVRFQSTHNCVKRACAGTGAKPNRHSADEDRIDMGCIGTHFTVGLHGYVCLKPLILRVSHPDWRSTATAPSGSYWQSAITMLRLGELRPLQGSFLEQLERATACWMRSTGHTAWVRSGCVRPGIDASNIELVPQAKVETT